MYMLYIHSFPAGVFGLVRGRNGELYDGGGDREKHNIWSKESLTAEPSIGRNGKERRKSGENPSFQGVGEL